MIRRRIFLVLNKWEVELLLFLARAYEGKLREGIEKLAVRKLIEKLKTCNYD